MPGPFFSESKVANSYHMLVSWKQGGQWTTPINHAHQSFANYQVTYNPIHLNVNRLERSLYEAVVRKSIKHKHVFQSKEWDNLVRYTKTKMIPVGSDSMKITLLVETPTNKDSVLINNIVKCLWDGSDR